MNKYLLLLSLAFFQYNIKAQENIDFRTIDIIKSEDSNPNSFAALSNKIYFFANDGKNYSDYFLWNLDKNSNKIEQSKFTVKGNYYKTSFLGSLNETIYYLDTNDYNNTKLYLVSESKGEQIVLSKISDFNILQEQSNFLIVSYVKDKIQYITKVTSNDIEELINAQDESLKQSAIIDDVIYFISRKKIIKFNINSKTKEEINISTEFEFYEGSVYNSLNYFNGDIYYSSLDYINWKRKVVKFNLNSMRFEALDLPETVIYSFYSTNDFAIFQGYNQIYKIDKNNIVTKFDSLSTYQIKEAKVFDNRLFLHLLSFEPYSNKLAEVKNNEVVFHDYEVYLNSAFFDQNRILTINNNQLSAYDIETKKEEILNNENLKVHNILGIDHSSIYLNASTRETGRELFVYNKSNNKMEFYGDINARPGSYPKRFYNVGDKVFYEGNYEGYSHLYVSDGTLEGTRVVKSDSKLALNNNSTGNSLEGLEFNGKFLFGGDKGNQSGHELWVTDGTDGGTYEIEINTETVGPHSNISGFEGFIAKTPTKVYFNGYVPNKGSELWVTDGTKEGTKMVKDLVYGSSSPMLSIPKKVILGEKLFFVKMETKDDNYRSDLWITDGSENGTKKITELTEFWNWYSHYYIKIFDVDEKYLYYSKYYVAPYGEEQMTGDYIHRLNLSNLNEDRLYKYNSDNVNVNKGIFYFSEYVDNKFNFVSYDKNTNEKKTILENVSYNLAYITTCGNYSIIADTDFSGYLGKSYFYNHKNGKVERIFKNDFASSSKNSIACVNDNILINYYDYSEQGNKKLISIKDDKIIEYPLSLDNSTNINTFLSSEMIYNSKLKKLFINPSNPDNELAVADFYLEDLNTEDLNVNNDLKSLILYPNPADNIVNIKSISNIETFTLIDFTGKIIKEQKNLNQKEIKLNISGIPKGIYIINVKNDKESISKKIIIK